MNKYLPTLRSALKDPVISNLDCICPSNKQVLEDIVSHLPDNAIISEWKYTIGNVKYLYHIHTNGINKKLNEAYINNVRGGNPKLTKIYSKKELKKIIELFKDYPQ